MRLVNQLADLTDFRLRQAIIYVVESIRSGSPEVLRLLTAYWAREPALMAVLNSPQSAQTGSPCHGR